MTRCFKLQRFIFILKLVQLCSEDFSRISRKFSSEGYRTRVWKKRNICTSDRTNVNEISKVRELSTSDMEDVRIMRMTENGTLIQNWTRPAVYKILVGEILECKRVKRAALGEEHTPWYSRSLVDRMVRHLTPW